MTTWTEITKDPDRWDSGLYVLTGYVAEGYVRGLGSSRETWTPVGTQSTVWTEA